MAESKRCQVPAAHRGAPSSARGGHSRREQGECAVPELQDSLAREGTKPRRVCGGSGTPTYLASVTLCMDNCVSCIIASVSVFFCVCFCAWGRCRTNSGLTNGQVMRCTPALHCCIDVLMCRTGPCRCCAQPSLLRVHVHMRYHLDNFDELSNDFTSLYETLRS